MRVAASSKPAPARVYASSPNAGNVGGAIAGSLGSLLVLIALQVTPATRAAMLGMFEPVVTVALSVVLLGDLMTWLRGLGIAVVLGGIALIHLRRFA